MEHKPVKEMKQQDTTFIFYEDCCKDTTEGEIRAILDQIAKEALPAMRAEWDVSKNEI
ncbi:hypothetical protein [Lacrimispora sp. JR3]|uniref:hypothetical protein n=1 Tax=Lacrimispora sinapis TaxID=3111456 RepID=UPI00374891A9